MSHHRINPIFYSNNKPFSSQNEFGLDTLEKIFNFHPVWVRRLTSAITWHSLQQGCAVTKHASSHKSRKGGKVSLSCIHLTHASKTYYRLWRGGEERQGSRLVKMTPWVSYSHLLLRECHLPQKGPSNNNSLFLREQVLYTQVFHESFSSCPTPSAVGTLKGLASNLKH